MIRPRGPRAGRFIGLRGRARGGAFNLPHPSNRDVSSLAGNHLGGPAAEVPTDGEESNANPRPIPISAFPRTSHPGSVGYDADAPPGQNLTDIDAINFNGPTDAPSNSFSSRNNQNWENLATELGRRDDVDEGGIGAGIDDTGFRFGERDNFEPVDFDRNGSSGLNVNFGPNFDHGNVASSSVHSDIAPLLREVHGTVINRFPGPDAAGFQFDSINEGRRNFPLSHEERPSPGFPPLESIDFSVPPPNFPKNPDFTVPPPSFPGAMTGRGFSPGIVRTGMGVTAPGLGVPGVVEPMMLGNNPRFRVPSACNLSVVGTAMRGIGSTNLGRSNFRGRFDQRGGRSQRFVRGSRGRGLYISSNHGGDSMERHEDGEETQFLPPLSYKNREEWNADEKELDSTQDDQTDLTPSSHGTPVEETKDSEARLCCPGCMKSFDEAEDFDDHIETCQENDDTSDQIEFICANCDAVFSVQDDYHDHIRNEHDMSVCRLCTAEFNKKEELKMHIETSHKKKPFATEDVKTAQKMGFTAQTTTKRGRTGPLSFYKKLGKRGTGTTKSSTNKSTTPSLVRSTSSKTESLSKATPVKLADQVVSNAKQLQCKDNTDKLFDSSLDSAADLETINQTAQSTNPQSDSSCSNDPTSSNLQQSSLPHPVVESMSHLSVETEAPEFESIEETESSHFLSGYAENLLESVDSLDRFPDGDDNGTGIGSSPVTNVTSPRQQNNPRLADKSLTPGSRVKQYERRGFKITSKMALMSPPPPPKSRHREEPTWDEPPRQGVPWGPGIDDGLPERAPFLPHSLWTGNSSPSQGDSTGEFSEHDFEQLDSSRMFHEPREETSPSPPPPPPSPPPKPVGTKARVSLSGRRSPLSSGGRSSGKSLGDEKDITRGWKKIEPQVVKKRMSMTQRWVSRAEGSNSPPPPLSIDELEQCIGREVDDATTPPPPPSPPPPPPPKNVKFVDFLKSPPVKTKFKEENRGRKLHDPVGSRRESVGRKGGWPREDVTMRPPVRKKEEPSEEEAGTAWIFDDNILDRIIALKENPESDRSGSTSISPPSPKIPQSSRQSNDEEDGEEDEEDDDEESEEEVLEVVDENEDEIERVQRRIASLREKLQKKEEKEKERKSKEERREQRRKEKEIKRQKLQEIEKEREKERLRLKEEEEKQKKREREMQRKLMEENEAKLKASRAVKISMTKSAELLPSKETFNTVSSHTFDIVGTIIGDSAGKNDKAARLEKEKRICPDTSSEMLKLLNKSVRPDKLLPPKLKMPVSVKSKVSVHQEPKNNKAKVDSAQVKKDRSVECEDKSERIIKSKQKPERDLEEKEKRNYESNTKNKELKDNDKSEQDRKNLKMENKKQIEETSTKPSLLRNHSHPIDPYTVQMDVSDIPIPDTPPGEKISSAIRCLPAVSASIPSLVSTSLASCSQEDDMEWEPIEHDKIETSCEVNLDDIPLPEESQGEPPADNYDKSTNRDKNVTNLNDIPDNGPPGDSPTQIISSLSSSDSGNASGHPLEGNSNGKQDNLNLSLGFETEGLVKFSIKYKDTLRSIELAKKIAERKREKTKEKGKKNTDAQKKSSSLDSGVEALFREYGSGVFEKQKQEEKRREEEKKLEEKRKEEEKKKAEKKAEERRKEEKRLKEEKRKRMEEEENKRKEEKKLEERKKKEEEKRKDEKKKSNQRSEKNLESERTGPNSEVKKSVLSKSKIDKVKKAQGKEDKKSIKSKEPCKKEMVTMKVSSVKQTKSCSSTEILNALSKDKVPSEKRFDRRVKAKGNDTIEKSVNNKDISQKKNYKRNTRDKPICEMNEEVVEVTLIDDFGINVEDADSLSVLDNKEAGINRSHLPGLPDKVQIEMIKQKKNVSDLDFSETAKIENVPSSPISMTTIQNLSPMKNIMDRIVDDAPVVLSDIEEDILSDIDDNLIYSKGRPQSSKSIELKQMRVILTRISDCDIAKMTNPERKPRSSIKKGTQKFKSRLKKEMAEMSSTENIVFEQNSLDIKGFTQKAHSGETDNSNEETSEGNDFQKQKAINEDQTQYINEPQPEEMMFMSVEREKTLNSDHESEDCEISSALSRFLEAVDQNLSETNQMVTADLFKTREIDQTVSTEVTVPYDQESENFTKPFNTDNRLQKKFSREVGEADLANLEKPFISAVSMESGLSDDLDKTTNSDDNVKPGFVDSSVDAVDVSVTGRIVHDALKKGIKEGTVEPSPGNDVVEIGLIDNGVDPVLVTNPVLSAKPIMSVSIGNSVTDPQEQAVSLNSTNAPLSENYKNSIEAMVPGADSVQESGTVEVVDVQQSLKLVDHEKSSGCFEKFVSLVSHDKSTKEVDVKDFPSLMEKLHLPADILKESSRKENDFERESNPDSINSSEKIIFDKQKDERQCLKIVDKTLHKFSTFPDNTEQNLQENSGLSSPNTFGMLKKGTERSPVITYVNISENISPFNETSRKRVIDTPKLSLGYHSQLYLPSQLTLTKPIQNVNLKTPAGDEIQLIQVSSSSEGVKHGPSPLKKLKTIDNITLTRNQNMRLSVVKSALKKLEGYIKNLKTDDFDINGFNVSSKFRTQRRSLRGSGEDLAWSRELSMGKKVLVNKTESEMIPGVANDAKSKLPPDLLTVTDKVLKQHFKPLIVANLEAKDPNICAHAKKISLSQVPELLTLNLKPPDEPDKNPSENLGNSADSRNKSEGFYCKLCPFSVSTKTDILAHLVNVHHNSPSSEFIFLGDSVDKFDKKSVAATLSVLPKSKSCKRKVAESPSFDEGDIKNVFEGTVKDPFVKLIRLHNEENSEKQTPVIKDSSGLSDFISKKQERNRSCQNQQDTKAFMEKERLASHWEDTSCDEILGSLPKFGVRVCPRIRPASKLGTPSSSVGRLAASDISRNVLPNLGTRVRQKDSSNQTVELKFLRANASSVISDESLKANSTVDATHETTKKKPPDQIVASTFAPNVPGITPLEPTRKSKRRASLGSKTDASSAECASENEAVAKRPRRTSRISLPTEKMRDNLQSRRSLTLIDTSGGRRARITGNMNDCLVGSSTPSKTDSDRQSRSKKTSLESQSTMGETKTTLLSSVRTAFDKIMDVSKRVPQHDWQEDFEFSPSADLSSTRPATLGDPADSGIGGFHVFVEDAEGEDVTAEFPAIINAGSSPSGVDLQVYPVLVRHVTPIFSFPKRPSYLSGKLNNFPLENSKKISTTESPSSAVFKMLHRDLEFHIEDEIKISAYEGLTEISQKPVDPIDAIFRSEAEDTIEKETDELKNGEKEEILYRNTEDFNFGIFDRSWKKKNEEKLFGQNSLNGSDQTYLSSRLDNSREGKEKSSDTMVNLESTIAENGAEKMTCKGIVGKCKRLRWNNAKLPRQKCLYCDERKLKSRLWKHIQKVHPALARSPPCGFPKSRKVISSPRVDKCTFDFCDVLDNCANIDTHWNYLNRNQKRKKKSSNWEETMFNYQRLKSLQTSLFAYQSVPVDECEKKFQSKNCSNVYMRQYAGLAYHCKNCDAVFRNYLGFNRHRLTIHRLDNNLKCPQCPYETTKNAKLKHQISFIHSKISNAPCTLCSNWFNARLILAYSRKICHSKS